MSLNFRMVHENYNVKNLEESLEFYEKALGLKEKRRSEASDESYILPTTLSKSVLSLFVF